MRSIMRKDDLYQSDIRYICPVRHIYPFTHKSIVSPKGDLGDGKPESEMYLITDYKHLASYAVQSILSGLKDFFYHAGIIAV